MRKVWQFLLVATLAVAPAGAARAQQAATLPPAGTQAQVSQPDQGGVNWKGVGVGAGAIAGNLLYVPAKLVYGILGGIAGGAGYVLTGGNQQVANTIWRSSLGGDYVLTPEMVTGQRPVHFSGPTTTAPAQPSAASPAAPTYGATAASNAVATRPEVSPLPPPGPGSTASPTHMMDSGAGPLGTAHTPYPSANASANNSGTGPLQSKPPLDTNIE